MPDNCSSIAAWMLGLASVLILALGRLLDVLELESPPWALELAAPGRRIAGQTAVFVNISNELGGSLGGGISQ